MHQMEIFSYAFIDTHKFTPTRTSTHITTTRTATTEQTIYPLPVQEISYKDSICTLLNNYITTQHSTAYPLYAL